MTYPETFAERVLSARARRITQEQEETVAKKRKDRRDRVFFWCIAITIVASLAIVFRSVYVVIELHHEHESQWRTHPQEYTGIPWWPDAPRQLRQI